MGKATGGLKIWSFVIVAAAAAHLLIISDYQIPTALGVASSSDPLSTLTGTIMPLVGAFLPILVQILAAATVLAALAAGFNLAFRLLVATTLSFFATLLVSPTMVPLSAAVQNVSKTTQDILAVGDYTLAYLLFLLVLLLAHVSAKYGTQGGKYAFERNFIVFVVGGALVYVLFSIAIISYPLPREIKNIPTVLYRVWLPAESIVMKDGSRQIGYVLSADQEWTMILGDHPRRIQRVPSSEVGGRTICRTDRGPDKLPLIPNIEKPTDIDPCPGYPR